MTPRRGAVEGLGISRLVRYGLATFFGGIADAFRSHGYVYTMFYIT